MDIDWNVAVVPETVYAWVHNVVQSSNQSQQAPRNNGMEIRWVMNLSWVAAKEKWRSMGEQFLLEDVLLNVHSHVKGVWDCLVTTRMSRYDAWGGEWFNTNSFTSL